MAHRVQIAGNMKTTASSFRRGLTRGDESRERSKTSCLLFRAAGSSLDFSKDLSADFAEGATGTVKDENERTDYIMSNLNPVVK
jgi:hypothetical protein